MNEEKDLKKKVWRKIPQVHKVQRSPHPYRIMRNLSPTQVG